MSNEPNGWRNIGREDAPMYHLHLAGNREGDTVLISTTSAKDQAAMNLDVRQVIWNSVGRQHCAMYEVDLKARKPLHVVYADKGAPSSKEILYLVQQARQMDGGATPAPAPTPELAAS